MGEAASTLVDTVLQRVRDPQGSATPRAMVRTFLSEAQRFINGATEEVDFQVTFTTQPYQQVYPITPSFLDPATGQPVCLRIVDIRQDTRNLVMVENWHVLAQTDRQWFRKVGVRHEVWTAIGRDLLVVHPAMKDAGTITVNCVKLTLPFQNDQTLADLPDDLLPLLLDLTETFVSLRMRKFDGIKPLLDRLATRLFGVETAEGVGKSEG